MMIQKKSSLTIQVLPTPNPDSMKFVLNQKISDKTAAEFDTHSDLSSSPLAQKLLGLPWVSLVFIGEDFISVTKEDWVEWDTLKDPLREMILEHLTHGLPVIINKNKKENPNPFADKNKKDLEIIQKIKHILEQEIQPYVQMDGGYVDFSDYNEGKVYLKMRGACSGCPSAALTLKQGIESRLKKDISEIKEIIEI